MTHKTGRRNTSFLLAGYLYDDRGNRMTPSHANKRGVRYRYYVSQAVLQNRKAEVGSIPRISAPDIETLVADAIRPQQNETFPNGPSATMSAEPNDVTNDGRERELIAAHVERVIVRSTEIEITLREKPHGDADATSHTVTVPWKPTANTVRKGIASAPTGETQIDPVARETLLTAIGRARSWVRDLTEAKAGSLQEIAIREGKGERHVRLLASLAFLSPRIIAAIIDGSAPARLTVTGLARALPYAWSEQERQFGIS